MLDIDLICESLPGRTVLWLEQTDSTMLDAARLAEGGCPSGTVVGAEEQTAGQGRHGRSWVSGRGEGLYFSIVLRLPLEPAQQPMVTMALGLAVAEAIAHTSGAAVDLRWPNDVMIGDKKVCGILVQQQHTALICGIGINVNQDSFPAGIAPIAGSLRLATGRRLNREPMAIEVLRAIDRHVEILVKDGPEAILRLFTAASSYVRGRRVVVEQGDRELRGVTAGLDGGGFLILRQDDGSETVILAGGVRPERTEG
ncbi:MAG: biotin--[acetyl-CoA-carboxylase] ligase [Bryobacterales bacterium]|nr:biotin--[acetyl-CoA-carboxylase] ligase [Bryobacterales bacterium]